MDDAGKSADVVIDVDRELKKMGREAAKQEGKGDLHWKKDSSSITDMLPVVSRVVSCSSDGRICSVMPLIYRRMV